MTMPASPPVLIVGDSGSTKTVWRIVSQGETPEERRQGGFNPNYFSFEGFAEEVRRAFSEPEWAELRGELYFYCSGCGVGEMREAVEELLQELFPRMRVEVQHDLMGAARATCGDQPGIACILGTGSNSMCYDGVQEVDKVPSLGFILGDEGSGVDLGRRLLRAYFYRELPEDLRQPLQALLPGGREELVERLYHSEGPATFLASFAGFVGEHRRHPFCAQLLEDCFRGFVQSHVLKYEQAASWPVHFVGSVAFHFQEELLQVLREANLTPGKILKEPLDELVRYHRAHRVESL